MKAGTPQTYYVEDLAGHKRLRLMPEASRRNVTGPLG